MIKKVNFRKVALDKLQEQYGMSFEEAKRTWNRAYQKAARQVRQAGANKQINVTRELEASMFNRGTTLFNVDVMDLSPNVKIKKEFKQGDILKNFTAQKMESFFNKYKDARPILDNFKAGKIDFDEFKKQVKAYQNENPEYKAQNYDLGSKHMI